MIDSYKTDINHAELNEKSEIRHFHNNYKTKAETTKIIKMCDDDSLVESSIKGIKSLSMNCVQIFFAETVIYSILF